MTAPSDQRRLAAQQIGWRAASAAAPAHRPASAVGAPGRGRKGDRQAAQAAHRQIGEGLRLDARPPTSRPRRPSRPSPAPAARASMRIKVAIARARRRRRSSIAARCGRCGTTRATGRRSAPSASPRRPATENSGRPILAKAKALRSSDFGSAARKNGCASTARRSASSTCAARRLVAVAIERRAGARAHEIVDQRIARARYRRRSASPPST